MPWRTAVVASLCVAGLATSLAAPVSAHHSHANYDVSTWTVMEGTVKQLVLMAPHSIVYLDVKDEKGAVATWALEATNPARDSQQRRQARGRPRLATRSRCAVTCCGTAPGGACSAS